MRKDGFENMILTGQIEGKKDKGKQSITYLLSLSKLMVDQGLTEITQRQGKGS